MKKLILITLAALCGCAEQKPAEQIAIPRKVTHRVVSNGEKFAGQVCVTANGWDRWYQLATRDTYEEAQKDLRYGDFNWQVDGFREVTKEQADAIALNLKLKQLSDRLDKLEGQNHPDWGSLLAISTNRFIGNWPGLLITNSATITNITNVLGAAQ